MANGFGFAPSESNFIEPFKKPMSSMSPMIVYNTKTGNVSISLSIPPDTFIYEVKYFKNFRL